MPRLHAPSKDDSRLLPPFAALPERCIHVPATDAEFAAARAALMAAPVLGFDTESKPLFHAHQTDTGPHVVQLATCDQAWLLQLHHAQARALAADVLDRKSTRLNSSHSQISYAVFCLKKKKKKKNKKQQVE